MRKIVLAESKVVTIEKSLDGEYRVPAEDGYENGAYYTDDREDAIDTAIHIYGANAQIKFRSVREFYGPKYNRYRPGTPKKDQHIS